MHDFIHVVTQQFANAAVPALAVMAVGSIVLALLYWVWYGKAKRPPEGFHKGQAIAILLLLCYLGGLAAVTLGMRTGSEYRMGVQTRPLLAFWEAWNAFTPQVWLNPLLNIAMFIPFGILLPLAAKPFRRWYLMLAAGVGTSFLIEFLQYQLGRGQADVDDLLCNTLGAMLGYCLCMAGIQTAVKEWKAVWPYTALPVLSAAALAGVFLVYYIQPYGNLEDAPIFPADTSGTRWVLECELSDQPGTAGVYWAEPFTKETCDTFAEEFLRRAYAMPDFSRNDVIYYDNYTFYSDHSTYYLGVNHNDRSYEYSNYRVDWFELGPGTTTEEQLRAALHKIGIDVPETAEFLDEDGASGVYTFRVSRAVADGTLTDGILGCYVAEGGELYRVDNALSVCTLHSEAPVISEQEAYDRLCAGRFDQMEAFAFGYSGPHKEVHVTAYTLEYLADSKGFRQPVYYFTLSDERDGEQWSASGWQVFVPALA